MRNKLIGLTCMCLVSLLSHINANGDFTRSNVIGEVGIQRGGDDLSTVQQINNTDGDAAGDGFFFGLGIERVYSLGGSLWSTELRSGTRKFQTKIVQVLNGNLSQCARLFF